MSVLDHEAVQAFFRRHPAGTGGIAVFDCDGTLIRGDVGEAMLYHQIERFLFRHSPAALWPDHPERARLDELYRALRGAPPGVRAAGQAFGPFADMVLDWYFGQINAGAVAKACADIVRLWAGFTLEEVRAVALESYRLERASPLTERALGRRTLPRGIRYVRETVDLLTALHSRGVRVWAVSGSNRWSVEPVFARLGIPAGQVVGIELVERDGLLTPEPVQPVPVRKDKVGAMQKHIPGVPILCASDSRNDIPLLLYSSDLKVRVNGRGRDAEEFFRAVGGPPDASWVNIERPTLIMDGEP